MPDNFDSEKIPLWSSEEPKFDILSDDISGRIPVARIEHWQDFSGLLESEFFNRPQTQLIFRGHRRYDWSLMPTLGRVTESGIIDRQLAEQQLEYFKRAVRGRLRDNSLVNDAEEDELWAVGQHHGLMTPLLDWTYSPYVALFFAFAKEDREDEKENPYRAIYVLNKTFVSDDNICPEIRMFEPRKDDHGRLVNQAGLFTFSPYDSTIENKLADTIFGEDFEDEELRNSAEEDQANIVARYICKIYVKNEDRRGCMRNLRRMNVHHASLFPDLLGASEYCNITIAEEREQYEIIKSESRSREARGFMSDSRLSDIRDDFSAGLDNEDIAIVAGILGANAEQSVERGRIQFLAEKISAAVSELQTVDWYKRESILSNMRTKIRVLLRKYGYPVKNRDLAINNILDHLMNSASR